MHEQNQINVGRPTIGFLADGLFTSLPDLMWSGVADVAEELDVNAICFPGGVLRDPHRPQDQAANVLYELVAKARLDGLIIWGYVCSRVGTDELRLFYDRYRFLPLVSVAERVEGVPSVLVDNYGGMRASVAHLVDVHGCSRIAFIKGNEGFEEHEDRFRAYRDVLAERGLQFDESLVVTDAQREAFCRREGIVIQDVPYGLPPTRLLLDDRRVTFDGLAVCEDDSAIGALEVLQARGLRVPGDVAMVSFDDTRIGHCATPPLTTVHNPVHELGRRAAEVLLGMLAGEEVAEEVLVPAPLIVRQSCGCLPKEVTRVPNLLSGADQKLVSQMPMNAMLKEEQVSMASEMAQEAGFAEAALPKAKKEMENLLDAFAAEIARESSDELDGIFLSTLINLLHEASTTGTIEQWQNVVSSMCRWLWPRLSHEERTRAMRLWGQARVLIGQAALHSRDARSLQAEQQAQALRDISATLNTIVDLDELMDTLIEELPRLGIPSAYLSLYENPQPYTYAGSAPAWSQLVMAYGGKEQFGDSNSFVTSLNGDGRRFPSCELLPEGIWPQRQYNMVVQPLYFQERQLGLVVFEEGSCDGTVYDVLRGELSGALNSALIFRDLHRAREAAEKADHLKTRLLANVSHELRTPLHVILDRVSAVLESSELQSAELTSIDLEEELRRIRSSAEHQMRLINDLLDLSRAEVDELDVHLKLIDLRYLLADAFADMAPHQACSDVVSWQLQLPDRLPVIQADPVRLRQVILNLLSNARKFTQEGEIVLGAEVASSRFHIWVRDTGPGIPCDQQERIFEPFATVERADRRPEGVGLGLSITRRLVALHRGHMAVDSEPGQGSTFHIYLPLPSMSDQPALPERLSRQMLWLVGAQRELSDELVNLCQEQGLGLRRLRPGDDLKTALEEEQPAILAWDLADADPGEWALIQQLRKHPRLTQLPFILYEGGEAERQISKQGLTGVIDPAMDQGTLLKALESLCLPRSAGPVLIVDDEAQARKRYRHMVIEALPGYAVRVAENGAAALEVMAEDSPSLVLLDLMMPEIDGFAVLDWMRSSPQHRQVPVLILSKRMLTLDDIRRIEAHRDVVVQSKGVLSEDEMVASLYRSLFGIDRLSPDTSALVKRTLAYICENYTRSFSRQEMAETLGVSPRYLTRIFCQELGLSPWDYLNRYRIFQAKDLLRHTNKSITEVGSMVGFNDASYFSRVFRRLADLTPTEYREGKS